MAIAFYVPDEEELHTASGTASATSGGSSVQSPPASPINPNEFIQAFYDALYRYSYGGAVGETPHSPNCPTCGSPGLLPPSRSTTPLVSSPTSVQSDSVEQRSRRPKRKRLSSIGEALSDEDGSSSDSSSESSDSISSSEAYGVHTLDSHLRHMEAREQLQLFTGRIPPSKATSGSSKIVPENAPQTRSKTKAATSCSN